MALYSFDTYGQLEPFLQLEWLLTNGLGGFALGTVVGCNTRRYHGLLVAATMPPVGRMMMLNRLGELLVLDNKPEQTCELSINQFGDKFHPRGDKYLRRFELNDTAAWEYEVEGLRIRKEVQLLWMRNVVGIRYTLIDPGKHKRVQLSVLPFVSLRDFHAERRAGDAPLPSSSFGRKVVVGDDNLSLHVQADSGVFEDNPDWWYGHTYAVETERGQDDTEDLFTPGRFVCEMGAEATNGTPANGPTARVLTLWASLEPAPRLDWDAELKRRRTEAAKGEVVAEMNATAVLPTMRKAQSMTVHRLLRAANDFVVSRATPDGEPGTSIIAGYPWFADWGRDTMISLPGLLLVPGRFEQARQVLCVFAQYVSEGMIPNRFDDYTNEPHYNTVDASLWFIHACYDYARRSGDQATFEQKLLPACKAIIRGYRQGTRFGIMMDPADGLITQGDESTQLTWMDAKIGDTAFTPRQGKPVEINALWYHVLVLMGNKDLAAKVAESFRRAFWISPFRGMADVVRSSDSGPKPGDLPPGAVSPGAAAKAVTYWRDMAVRPNQIFAVSLSNSPLEREQQHAVVETVRRELLTPYGLRTLARSDPKYCPRYTGPQRQRDASYHNGAVWPWLIGPFLDAYLKVHDRSTDAVDQAKRWLAPLIDHLEEGCVGQISEIFEGDAPHRPVGSPAQAWSVAEVLRLAVELGM